MSGSSSSTAGRGETREVVVGDGEAGQRLDRVLASRLFDLSRSRLKALILEGRVTAGGRTLGDPGMAVKPGMALSVVVPAAAPAAPQAERIPLVVVHEDEHLIVIDKPAGLVVHPAAGHAAGTLVNALIAHCGESLSGIGGVRRPGIVHRLDKETSGLLVVAKTDAAHRSLSEQFAAHGRDGRLERTYRAVVWGVPTPREGRIAAPIGRHPSQRTRMAVVKPGQGRDAATRYKVEAVYAGADGTAGVACLVALSLETGRTHQIRVHLAHAGHPLLGDPVYGQGYKASARKLGPAAQSALAALGRQALHAAGLGFEHPATRRRLRFRSPLPPEMARLVAALGGGQESPQSQAKAKRR